MAKTELGKALEKLIIAGEKMSQALRDARDAVDVWEKKHIPPEDLPDNKVK